MLLGRVLFRFLTNVCFVGSYIVALYFYEK